MHLITEDIYSILSKDLLVIWLASKRLYLTGITPTTQTTYQKKPEIESNQGRPTIKNVNGKGGDQGGLKGPPLSLFLGTNSQPLMFYTIICILVSS